MVSIAKPSPVNEATGGDVEALVVGAAQLQRFASEMMSAAGLAADHADRVADCLVYADLCGVESHGVSRLPIYARRVEEGMVNPRGNPHVVTGSPLALRVVDGDNAPGAVVGSFAMNEAIHAAGKFGVGLAIAKRSNHFGMGAYYVRLAAARNFIGICGTNAPATMAVWGAREIALGTNPLAVGAPAGRYGDINLDMSSSTVAKGKILVHARKGLSIPEGWAIDIDGNPTTDAAAAAAGVVLPFAGPKGSGLALVIDLIAGVLSGAAFGSSIRDQYTDFNAPQDVGHFCIAIDISQVMPVEAYTARVEAFCAELKAKKLAQGVSEILLPGQSKRRNEQRHLTEGIRLDRTVEEQLDRLAESLGKTRLRESLGASA